jgi:hypothetical protein
MSHYESRKEKQVGAGVGQRPVFVQSLLCPHPTRSHVVLDHNSKSQETNINEERGGERKNKRDQRGYQTCCTRYHVVRVEEERRLFEGDCGTLEEIKGQKKDGWLVGSHSRLFPCCNAICSGPPRFTSLYLSQTTQLGWFPSKHPDDEVIDV